MTIDELNEALDKATDGNFLSPYSALEQVRDVLEELDWQLPAMVFCEGDNASHLFKFSEDHWLCFHYKFDGDSGLYEAAAEVLQKPEEEQTPPPKKKFKKPRNLTTGPRDEDIGVETTRA